MRALIAGLLGLSLSLTLMPAEAFARADARGSTPSVSSSRNAAPIRAQALRPMSPRATSARPMSARPMLAQPILARPSGSRVSAARPAAMRLSTARVAPARSAQVAILPSRHASSRSNANSTRHALVPRGASTQAGRRAEGRFAARAVPAGRAMANQRSGTGRQLAAIPYSRQAAMSPRGLRQTAMLACTTRNGRRTCAPAVRTASVQMRWTGGLAPAGMSQAGCPDGTIATLAIGHSDITRCVPL